MVGLSIQIAQVGLVRRDDLPKADEPVEPSADYKRFLGFMQLMNTSIHGW